MRGPLAGQKEQESTLRLGESERTGQMGDVKALWLKVRKRAALIRRRDQLQSPHEGRQRDAPEGTALAGRAIGVSLFLEARWHDDC